MKITESASNGFCILYPEGRVDSTQVPEFERHVLGCVERGENNLIINCRGLGYISSLGLRVFLSAQKKIIASKGKLYLCELTRPVLETIGISGFTTIFKIFETEEEALSA
jgi:anti-sigma B factor antagonist